MTSITFIGMAGVGKSTIGAKYARRHKLHIADIDSLLETKFQLSCSEIIDNIGEKAFIKAEEDTVLELSFEHPMAVITGGSVIYSETAMDYLKKNSLILLLDADPHIIESRLKNLPVRGIIGLKHMSFQDLYRQRKALYEKYADLSLFIPAKSTPKFILESIEEAISSR